MKFRAGRKVILKRALGAFFLAGPLFLGGCERHAAPGASQVNPIIQQFHLGLEELRNDISQKGEVTRQVSNAGALEKTPDGAITRALEERLYGDPDVPAFLVAITTTGACVTLTGRVGSLEQLQKALLLSLTCPGVQAVTAKLSVEPDDGTGATQGNKSQEDGRPPATPGASRSEKH